MYSDVQLRFAQMQPAARSLQCGIEALAVVKAVTLGQIADAEPFLQHNVAAVRCFQPCQNAEQGGFAGTVRADQPDAVAGLDAEAEFPEEFLCAKGLA